MLIRYPREVLLEAISKGCGHHVNTSKRFRKIITELFIFLIDKGVLCSSNAMSELRGSLGGILKRAHPKIKEVVAHLSN